MAAVFVTARAITVKGHRWGWAAIALAIWLYTAAEFVWLAFIGNDPNAPYPSVADYLWLSFYPAAYIGLVLLFRSRFTGITTGLWIDGVTAALAAATLGSAVIVQAVLGITEGSTATVATGLAYPLGDVVLLSLVIAAFSLTAWRPGRVWWLIGLSLLLFAVGDSIYLYLSAKGHYVEGQVLDVVWPAALLLLAVAAWQDSFAGRRIDIRGRALLAVPAACALIAAGVLVVDHFERLNLLAIVLALATLVCVLVRLGLTFRENGRLLELTRSEAITDALTGLGNRRSLLRELERELEPARGKHVRAARRSTTSTASRATTTRSATRPATRSWRGSAASSRRPLWTRVAPTASAETSSASSPGPARRCRRDPRAFDRRPQRER